MAVVIRLARTGTKNAPKYRITVADSRRYATSKFIEVLGTYTPTVGGKGGKIDMDIAKAQSWIKKGAQPTDRVKHLMKLAQKA